MKQLLHQHAGSAMPTGESAPSATSYPTWNGTGSGATSFAPSHLGHAAATHVGACALGARVIGRTKPMTDARLTDARRRPPETPT